MAGAQVVLSVVKQAAKTIPWKKVVVTVGPIIWDPVKEKIKELIGRIGNPRPASPTEVSIAALNERVCKLEQLCLELGKLTPELDAHQKVVAEALQTLSARIVILFIVAGVSVVSSVIALALILIR